MATSRSAPSSTAGTLREDEHPAGEADELLANESTLVDGHEHEHDDNDNEEDNDAQDSTHRPLRASVEQEFARAPPAWWKRLALLAGIVLAGWISIKLGQSGKRDVIYAQRCVCVWRDLLCRPCCSVTKMPCSYMTHASG